MSTLHPYPIATPDVLSPDALTLYKRGCDSYTDSITIDRDWFTPEAHRMRKQSFRDELTLDPKYTPDERTLAAIDDLERAGLGSLSDYDGKNLTINRVHPKRYTTVEGDGPWVARLSLMKDMRSDARSEATLLAVLDGAEVETRSGNSSTPTMLVVRSLIPGATDFEHSSASSAFFEIAFPTFPEMHDGLLSYYGILTDARMYPMGTDPHLIDEHDPNGEGFDEPQQCGYSQCTDEEAHFIAPYLPPEVPTLHGRKVFLDVRPKRD